MDSNVSRSGGNDTQLPIIWGKNSTGFWIKQTQGANPSNYSGLEKTDVSLMIMEAGMYHIGGLKVEVGQYQANGTYRTIPFSAGFGSSPSVIASVQSNFLEAPLHTRIGTISASSMSIKMEETGYPVSAREETIGYIAIEKGEDTTQSLVSTGIMTNHTFVTLLRGQTGSLYTPFAHLNSDNDPEQAYAVARNVTDTGIEVAVEESLFSDGSHGNESISILMIKLGTIKASILSNNTMRVAATIDGPGIVSTVVSYSINGINQTDAVMTYFGGMYYADLASVTTGDVVVITIEAVNDNGIIATYTINRTVL